MKRRLFTIGSLALIVTMAMGLSGYSLAAKNTIRYWTFLDPNSTSDPRCEAQKQIINNFEKKNPSIDVRVEFVPWGRLTPDMIQAAEAGNTPDVARCAITYLAMETDAKSILPLDEFTKKWSKANKQDWLLPESYTTVNGKRMALFIEHRARGLFVRKDLFDQAGLPLPKSLDELASATAKISKTGVNGFVVGISKKEDGAMFGEWFLQIMASLGYDLEDKQGKASFNNEAGVRIMQWLYDMVNKYNAMPSSVASMGAEDSLMGMKAGRIAVMPEGSHRMAAARAAAGMADKIIFMPSLGFDPAKPAPAITSGYTLVMGKDTKNKLAAWKFIEWVTSRESMVINAKIGGEMPARKSSYNDPFFKTGKGLEMLEWRGYVEKYGMVPTYPEKWSLMMAVLCDAAQEIIVNKIPPKQALDTAATRYNEG